MGPKYNEKAIVGSCDFHTSPVPVGMLCQASYYCNLLGSQLGKTEFLFPWNHMHSTLQQLDLSMFYAQLHSVISNSIFVSSSEG